MRFKVITTGFNCAPFIEGCIRSLREQRNAHFDVLVVDDATPDGGKQASLIEDAVAGDRRFTVQVNEERKGTLRNQIEGIRSMNPDPDDVIVWVDLDDKLSHPEALGFLGAVYGRDPLLELTYGSYRSVPHSPTCAPAMPYPEKVRRRNSYRAFMHEPGGGIWFNHLRTMRYRLIEAMEDGDFQYDDGRWFQACPDGAVMIPALELSRGRWKCLPEVLLDYSSENPISDWRRQPREVDRVHQIIARRPKK